jgi:riboflavin synthase alpha subunit
MIEVVLRFKDGEEITVKLQDFIAYEWKDDKKINGNLKRQGAEIISFDGVCMKDGKVVEKTEDGLEVEVMPDGLRVLNVDSESAQKLEDHLFETDERLKDLKEIKDVVGYTEFPDLKERLS